MTPGLGIEAVGGVLPMSVSGLSGLVVPVNLSFNVSKPEFDRGQCQNKPGPKLVVGEKQRVGGRERKLVQYLY